MTRRVRGGVGRIMSCEDFLKEYKDVYVLANGKFVYMENEIPVVFVSLSLAHNSRSGIKTECFPTKFISFLENIEIPVDLIKQVVLRKEEDGKNIKMTITFFN